MTIPTPRSDMPEPFARLLASYREAAESGAGAESAMKPDDVPTVKIWQMVRDAVEQVGLPPGLTANTVLADRYELLEAIGSGATCQVWRARDRKFDREVAVKVLTAIASAAMDVEQLVDREGRLLAKLDHPGAVRVQDAGRDGEYRFLVMDLIGGVSLSEALDALRTTCASRTGPLIGVDVLALSGKAPADTSGLLTGKESWVTAVTRIIVELLRTLEAAHGVGIVHRDLKPANIRLIAGARPVLLDFGHSLTCDHVPGTLTAALFGTAPYAAPEQWEGVDKVGPLTDVYQVGVVLYELLTLKRCFPDDSTVETMRCIRDGHYQRPRSIDPNIPPALEACLLRAMERDPQHRYASAAAFRADLERWLEGSPTDAGRTLQKVAAKLRSTVRRNRWAITIACAVLLGAWLTMLWPGSLAEVARISGQMIRVKIDAPAVMLAFRIREADDGTVFCAPVRLSGGDDAGRPTLQRTLQAGASDIQLLDVGDAPPSVGSSVQTVFADVANDDAVKALGRLADAMQQACDAVERRNGIWLSRDEVDGLLQPARGGSGGDVAVPIKPAARRWQQEGLRVVVIPWGGLLAPDVTRGPDRTKVLDASRGPDPAKVPDATIGPDSTKAPATLALLVGIDSYKQPENGEGLAPLRGATNDVARAKALLIEQFGFDAAGIETLIGPQATHEAIVTMFHHHLIERAGPDTRVVFWFSGHGSRIPDASGLDGAAREDGESAWDDTLVAYDSRWIDPAGSFDVADDELFSLLRALRARDVVVITDCCHSGGVLRGPRQQGVRDAGLGTAPLDLARIKAFWPHKSAPLRDDGDDLQLLHVVQVAACGAKEEAGEVGLAAGTFGTCTWYLTQGLRGAGPDTSWDEICDSTRALVAGKGTRGGQRVQLVGDGTRLVLGGRGRAAPPGFVVEPYGRKSLIVGGGSIHGIGVGARLQLVDYDRKQIGMAVVSRVGVSSCNARWQGRGKPPRVAMRAQPVTFGEKGPKYHVALGTGVNASVLDGSAIVALAEANTADYTIARDSDGLSLFDRSGRWVRGLSAKVSDLQVDLLCEHYWRALWHSVAEPGRFKLRVTVAPASSDDSNELGYACADRLRIDNGPDGETNGAIAGVTCFGDAKEGGGLVRIHVANLNDCDLHIAIISVSENREISVLYGKDESNVVAAGKGYTKRVWLGRDPRWKPGDAMVDRYVVIATSRYADFTPFAAARPTNVTRGGDETRELPPFLRQVLNGRRTRGSNGVVEPTWGVAYVDIQLITPTGFDQLIDR